MSHDQTKLFFGFNFLLQPRGGKLGIDQQQNGSVGPYVKLHLYRIGHPSCLLKFFKSVFRLHRPQPSWGGLGEKFDPKPHDNNELTFSMKSRKYERTLGRMRPKFRPPSVPVGIH